MTAGRQLMERQGHPRAGSQLPRRGGDGRSSRRRAAAIGVLLMAAAVLLFIALASYNPGDEASTDVHASDLFKVLTGDAVAKAKADTAHNWLGLVGAFVSEFLIKSTLGYMSFCFPVLLLVWGWVILRREGVRGAVIVSNYTLIGAILLSATFGMIRAIVGETGPGSEWSGVVGDFLSLLLIQLVGKAGGSVILLAALMLTVVLAADVDLRETAQALRATALRFMDWLTRMNDRRREAVERRRREHHGTAETERDAPVRIAKAAEELPAEEEPRRAPVVVRPTAAVGRDTESGAGAGEPGTSPPKPLRVDIERPEDEKEEEGLLSAPQIAEEEEIDYVFPSVDLLQTSPGRENVDEEELKANADLLRDTLLQFNVELESVSVTPGPVVTLYELVPATGVKISSIVSLENDIALKLAAKGIRIMAPIPGKSAVGVEIPNAHPSIVTVRSVINSAKFRDSTANLPIAMGKTIFGEVYTDDLSKMPHLLMAGSTGSGKSVGINTIIASLLYRMHPADLKLVIIDPKKIEMAQYAKLKHHYLAISPDVDEEIITTPRNAVLALRGVEYEMENRYDRLAAAGVRNIVDYNERLKSGKLKSTGAVTHVRMPFLLVVIDELADLMITAAREVEEPIARLAQLARAVGIHLVVATQRPSVDVITGVIKANFPARIAYQVASKTDSRTILDLNGAEQLLGNGDMLYLASGSPKPVRLQNPYITPDEVDALVDHVARQKGFSHPHTLPSIVERKRAGEAGGEDGRDELFEEAARLIVRHQQGSVSLLQRRLKVGYSRAARLVDELEAAGIVGPFDGSKAREVLVETEQELESILRG